MGRIISPWQQKDAYFPLSQRVLTAALKMGKPWKPTTTSHHPLGQRDSLIIPPLVSVSGALLTCPLSTGCPSRAKDAVGLSVWRHLKTFLWLTAASWWALVAHSFLFPLWNYFSGYQLQTRHNSQSLGHTLVQLSGHHNWLSSKLTQILAHAHLSHFWRQICGKNVNFLLYTTNVLIGAMVKRYLVLITSAVSGLNVLTWWGFVFMSWLKHFKMVGSSAGGSHRQWDELLSRGSKVFKSTAPNYAQFQVSEYTKSKIIHNTLLP